MFFRFIGKIYRAGYFVSGLFRVSSRKPTEDPDKWSRIHPWFSAAKKSEPRPTEINSPPHFDAFVEFLHEVGPLCSYFDYIKRTYLEDTEQLKRAYHNAYENWIWPFQDAWARAVRIYRKYVQGKRLWYRNGQFQRATLNQVMETCLKKGQASVWSELLEHNAVDTVSDKHLGDDACLVSHLLHEYAKLEYAELDPHKYRLHRPRDAAGDVQYDQGKLDWSSYQLDRRIPRSFCSCPEEREARFRRDVTMQRILWDISTRIRSRRLLELTKSLDDQSSTKINQVKVPPATTVAELQELGFYLSVKPEPRPGNPR